MKAVIDVEGLYEHAGHPFVRMKMTRYWKTKPSQSQILEFCSGDTLTLDTEADADSVSVTWSKEIQKLIEGQKK